MAIWIRLMVFAISGTFLALGLQAHTPERTAISRSSGFWVKNMGQLPSDVLYISDIQGGRLTIRRKDFVIQIIEPLVISTDDLVSESSSSVPGEIPPISHGNEKTAPLRVSNAYLTFTGGCWDQIVGEGNTKTAINIFKSQNPLHWYSNIPTFQTIRVKNLYPGLDLVFDASGNAPGLWYFEKHSELATSADINLRIDTMAALQWKEDAICLSKTFGTIIFPFPAVLQDGRIVGNIEFLPNGNAHLTESTSDSLSPCVQPKESEVVTLVWATFLGGNSGDYCSSAALSADGAVIVGGQSTSSDCPAPRGYDATYNGSSDFYVAKLSASGNTLLWATYLGGHDWDSCRSIALDGSDNIVVGGYSNSSDCPTPNSYDGTYNGGSDFYIAKLSASGNALLWATYLGGSDNDECYCLALDGSDNIFIGGFSESRDCPVPGAYDASFNGVRDFYIAKLKANGDTLLWASYLGGVVDDECHALVLDNSGNVIVGGYSRSPGGAPPGGYDTTLNGAYDFYIAKLSASGNALLWATYLGGMNNDYCYALALDMDGNVVAGGATWSPNCPTLNGFDSTHNGASDLYIAKLSATGSTLLWATYIGGKETDTCTAIAVGPSSEVIAVGATQSADIPKPNGYDTTLNGYLDYYIAKLSASGNSIPWATYLGSRSNDYCNAVVLSSSGNIIVSGHVGSSECPTPGGYDKTFNGGADIYIASLSPAGCPPLTISPNTFPGGILSVYFSQRLTASGGSEPHTFAISSGILPPGLTLASNGLLSGSPSAVGRYDFTVTATDSSSLSCTGDREYIMNISSLDIPPEVIMRDMRGQPGASISIPLDLLAHWNEVCGLTDTVTFDTSFLQFVSAYAGPSATAAGKQVNYSVSQNKIDLTIGGSNANTMGDGTIAILDFQISNNASGISMLTSDCLISDCYSRFITSSCLPCTVNVGTSPGDCDGDGLVSIGEVQKAINMFLGTAVPDCGVDCDGNGSISIGEVQKVINAFLGLPASC